MTLPWLVVLVLVVLLVAVLVLWGWERGRAGRRSRARLRVAGAGESAAEGLLAELGFDVLERQLVAEWVMEVDGEPVRVASRVDLLVERDGETFVAEVKTGELAPDPARPATRRQLLEYQLVFEADGVLLVDMEARAVRAVRLFTG